VVNERGRGADGEAHQDVAGRSRFRLSLTVAVLQLAVAVAGVGVALLVGWRRDGLKDGQRTTYSISQIAHAAGSGSRTRSGGHSPTAPASHDSRTAASPGSQMAPVDPGRSRRSTSVYGSGWPVGFDGYTVALASDVIESDAAGAVAKARAAGLVHVGVLRSDRYASLTPGYWFVFSGVYATVGQARREVSGAVHAGFSDAYVRRVAE
jgi:hypothetical protein